MKVLFTDAPDPAMRYEGMVQAALDCNKDEDTWGYANRERFAIFFVNNGVTDEGREALKTVAAVVIFLHQQSIDGRSILEELSSKIQSAKTQSDIVAIIDRIIAILSEIE